MNSFYDDAGLRIRELREINRYTREEFSEIVGISSKFLYEIETGQKGFSADTLYRISKGLSVSCEYILTGDEQSEYDKEVLNALKLFNNTQIKTVQQMLKLVYELSARK
ncbi:MAG: family transcriptional regulator [Anaerocolumna sp.]|jgi:transcriptional regulator with XRE-family HTH domain|nr:family transcriptional regulator [Anaerocolumna sp.]